MAKKYIDADKLMKAMYHRAFETDGDTMWQSGCWVRYRAIEQTIKEQPAADVRENVHGEWKDVTDNVCIWKVCTECGSKPLRNEFGHEILSSFCPNCGAYMR